MNYEYQWFSDPHFYEGRMNCGGFGGTPCELPQGKVIVGCLCGKHTPPHEMTKEEKRRGIAWAEGYKAGQKEEEQRWINQPANEHDKRIREEVLREVIEKLDEMAFEQDTGKFVELFINWDKAKKALAKKI